MFVKKKDKTAGRPVIIEIDGIKFKTSDGEKNKEIEKIAKLYPKRLNDIVVFMANHGIFDMFGDKTLDELENSLGTPMIRTDAKQIIYANHNLDTEHIISMEYAGDLEEFYNLVIDG